MTYPDYKVQIIREPAQWKSGLLSKLDLGKSGLSLFASPSFQEWVVTPDDDRLGSIGPVLAVDECGQLLWVQCMPAGRRTRCGLWLYDRENRTREKLVDIDSTLDGAATPLRPARLWVGEWAVWLFDSANGRVYAFDRDTFQLVRTIQLAHRAIDVAFDGSEWFYALEQASSGFEVSRYNAQLDDRERVSWRCTKQNGEPLWVRPVGLAVSRRFVWILDQGPPGETPSFVRIALPPEPLHQPSGVRPCAAPESPGVPRPRCELVPIPRKRPDRCCKSPDGGLEADLIPERLTVDCQDNLLVVFVGASGLPRLFQFDTDGSLLGEVRLPTRPAPPGTREPRTPINRIDAVLATTGGTLFLVSDIGLARFGFDHVPIGESGVYYVRPLDNGVEDGTWHRLALRGALPTGTRLVVEGFASNDAALKTSVDTVLDSALSVQEKRRELESRLGPSWIQLSDLRGPSEAQAGEAPGQPPRDDVLRSASPVNLNHDLLFIRRRTAATEGGGPAGTGPAAELRSGRYLWLRLTLSSFDEARRPSIREIQVFHPRMSYLRYLPATYQEDPRDPSSENTSREFLERFLSLFETFFWSLDVEIDQLFQYFDAETTPADFLSWLARWLNLALEEEWSDARKRALIGRAWQLYERKGTPAGLTELIELVTGWSTRILEDSRVLAPVPLGADWRLARNTFVRGTPPRGLRLGDSSVLGRVALQQETPDPSAPFTAAAHRFTVLLYGDLERFRREERRIRRLIDEYKPAHAAYTLHLVGDGAMGLELRAGINTRFLGGAPLRLGHNTALGKAVIVSRTRPATRPGSANRLGDGFELT